MDTVIKISYPNKRGELSTLLTESMNKPSVVRTNYPVSSTSIVRNKRIHFYEWSDLSRHPLVFGSVEDFEMFLHRSDIFLLGYQRDLLKSLDESHVVCRKGTKDLLIRMSKKLLDETFNAASCPSYGPRTPSNYGYGFGVNPYGYQY